MGDETKREREMFPNQIEEKFQIREIIVDCRLSSRVIFHEFQIQIFLFFKF